MNQIEKKGNVEYKPRFDIGETDDNVPVELLSGEFSGILYTYGKASFDFIEDEQENSVLSFDYDVKEMPEGMEPVNQGERKNRFEEVIGNILVDIITEYANDHRNKNDEGE